MTHIRENSLADIQFAMYTHGKIDQLLPLPAFTNLDKELLSSILEESEHFAQGSWKNSHIIGDQRGCQFKEGQALSAPEIKAAYQAFIEAGWGSLKAPIEYGGQGLPHAVSYAVEELLCTHNMALTLLFTLTNSAMKVIKAYASQELQDTFLPAMAEGLWSGTMELTESDAGSDLALIRTQAVKQDSGHYAISGSKIFITWGEHDLSDNLIHLVLARVPGAPPGTRGLSLFIVPKYLVNVDKSLGKRNSIELIGVENKIGLHASPTCELRYHAAEGYLVGEENLGLKYMFTMMNEARLAVGIEGCALSQAAYSLALSYAQERIQGKKVSDPKGQEVPIVEHGDVKRMLLMQKTCIEAGRAFYMKAAYLQDLIEHGSKIKKDEAQATLDFLVPIVKGFCTEHSVLSTNLAIQTFGGTGYIRETGIGQIMLAARVTPIYEGTTGIQALDALLRKSRRDHGQVAWALFARGKKLACALEQSDAPDLAAALNHALSIGEKMLHHIGSEFKKPANETLSALAVPYLNGMGYILGASLMAEAYLAAKEGLENDVLLLGPKFYQYKQQTAKIYFYTLLPQVETEYQRLIYAQILADYPSEGL